MDPHRLIFNITDRVDLSRSDKYFAFSDLSTY